ncbi:hypothetical protein F5Y19DRAFT_190649 [Xylariaceae sp. FL1651]|nr:hypothetical protein F5Y19DRAFT_190649 [Xylariaceae sp. FL1651]
MTTPRIPPRVSSIKLDQAMDSPRVRQTSLYNGVSNRSRGWKTRKPEKAPDLASMNPTVMRWDGASRSNEEWDNLRKDPELWFRNGNCYVHLYAEGQSRRGPAFKVPFLALLGANCHPLVDMFVARNHMKSNEPHNHDNYDPASYIENAKRHKRIDLFIPAPPQSDKRQSYHYHLATRNFFAFIFRRSMVGESLGSALIALMQSLYQFRTQDADNIRDLMNYMDEEGYLDLNCQPTHALAMLHLAEIYQLRDLYIDAFAHCCGMSDQLFLGPEYQLLSSVTRKLIRRARLEMDARLGKCGTMLKTFLQDELPEDTMGLYPGARAHLERFRTLLHGLYAARFGYYPPPSTDPETTIFEVDVFRTMRDDFEALYEYLVDDGFDTSQGNPFLVQGGICTLQSIQSFDARYHYETLSHPLPLLPEVSQESTPSRRVLWLNKPAKPNQTQRVNTLSALLIATNSRRVEVMRNKLVRAYRRFEEDSIYSPIKADKLENLGPMDGRKVRWILIYAIYQTLRQATEPPAEVRDITGVPYHLCISTVNLPPWKRERPVHMLVRSQSGQLTQSSSSSTMDWSSRSSSPPPQASLEIKPDIDYFAITHKSASDTRERGRSISAGSSGLKDSFTNPFSRTSLTVRRSFSFFTKQETQRPLPQAQKSSYYEIAVPGYGNGIKNTVRDSEMAVETASVKQASSIKDKRIVSSPPGSFYSSSYYSNSEAGTSDTFDTSVTGSPTEASIDRWESQRSSACTRCGHRDADRETPSPSPRRSKSLQVENRQPHAMEEASWLEDEEPLVQFRQRPTSSHNQPRRSLEPAPLNIRKAKTSTTDLPIQMPSPKAPTAWDYINAVMEVQATAMEDDVHPEWEQYNDLGGLIEIRSEAPTPAPPPVVRRASMVY